MIGNGEQLVGDGYKFLYIAEPTLLLEEALKNARPENPPRGQW
jgi:hypothetical protein